MKAQKVYFDESGNTGVDLLNEEQPFFTYAGVAFDEIKAKNIIEKINQQYPTQTSEIKFKNYREIVDDTFCMNILDLLKDFSGVVIVEKKFAISGLFYEYIFEPILADYNSFFYDSLFHFYITCNLYDLFEDAKNNKILSKFEEFMRQKIKTFNFEGYLDQIKYISSISRKSKKTFLEKLYLFMFYNQNKIQNEMKDLSHKYLLDVTFSAFLALCGFFNEKFEMIEPICDTSKILKVEKKYLDSTINRPFNIFSYNQRKIKICLKNNITFVDSKNEPNIQLADLLAGIANYAYKNNNENIKNKLIKNKFVAISTTYEKLEIEFIKILKDKYDALFELLVNRSIKEKPLLDDKICQHLYALKNTYQRIY